MGGANLGWGRARACTKPRSVDTAGGTSPERLDAPGITLDRQLSLIVPDAVPGRYQVQVHPDWNCPTVPQGGLMAALAARAMQLELGLSDDGPSTNGDGLQLRSLTTVFAAAVPAGPVTIDVRVLREGRSMAQVMATARSPEAPAGHTTLAAFGRRRAGFDFTDWTMPDVPPPEACRSFRDPPPPDVVQEGEVFAFWAKVIDGRPAMGHAPWEDYEPTTSDAAFWYRLEDLPFQADGQLDPLALVVYADTMPGSIGERMGPTKTDWWCPSVDLTVHLLREARSEWILGHSKAHRSNDGYASLQMHLWDPATGLVAAATQTTYFVFPD